MDVAWVDRASVQEVLGCSQTEAWRILRKLGAEPGPGGALVLARERCFSSGCGRIWRIPKSASNSGGGSASRWLWMR